MDENMARVIFQPSGRRGLVPKGFSIIEASRLLGADIEALCGEKRVCGKCKVRIEEGFFEKYGIDSKRSHVSPWQQEEEEKFINAADKEAGYRLACVTRIAGDLLVFVPEESRAGKQIVSKAARDIQIEHNPAVKLYTVAVNKPAFEDPTGDFERICKQLKNSTTLRISESTYKHCAMSSALRKGIGRLLSVSGWIRKLHVSDRANSKPAMGWRWISEPPRWRLIFVISRPWRSSTRYR